MSKSDAISFLAQSLIVIVALCSLPGIVKEGLNKDNYFTLIMLFGALSLVASYFTGIYTNTLDREDPAKDYPVAVSIKWSWINTAIQSVCLIAFIGCLIFTLTYFPGQKLWPLFCVLWIGMCITVIYRETKRRKYLKESRF
ncbi:hypothetical protein ERX35_000055 [Macrococcus equipercicus]|uniref:Uncharacterized protein n=1 Tax=Macrococcus equipercicus TaxID=69967 RepID=A0ABQ6RAU8_9STAP|nr:hypothetical protein [Macrococcus equipercicus]KAA1042311.1 hypothetical protein ERX35_000055 [Macrococcus equipercicus]